MNTDYQEKVRAAEARRREGQRLPSVAVTIATYRSPRQLTRLLRALERQTYYGHVALAVVDNDAEREEGIKACYALQDAGYRLPITAVVEPTVGRSSMRNTALAVAFELEAEMIVMIDDSAVPADGWLASLATTLNQHSADVVVGRAVHQSFDGKASEWPTLDDDPVAEADEEKSDLLSDDVVKSVEVLNNFAIRRHTLQLYMPSPMHVGLDFCGGGRRMWIDQMERDGRLIVRSQRAMVLDEVAPSELSSRAWLRQQYQVGGQKAVIYAFSHPTRLTQVSTAVGLSLLMVPMLVGVAIKCMMQRGSALRTFGRLWQAMGRCVGGFKSAEPQVQA